MAVTTKVLKVQHADDSTKEEVEAVVKEDDDARRWAAMADNDNHYMANLGIFQHKK